MSIVFFLCAGLSLGYFLLIVLYSGISTDFCGIWIAISAVFSVMGVFNMLARKERDSMPKRLSVFVFTTFVLWAAVSGGILFQIARASVTEDTAGCDYVIVIGERIYKDGISNTLKKRLEKAVVYAEDNPAAVLVLSGGAGSGDVLPEALAMYNYLVRQGVSEDRLLIDAVSVSTEDNIRNSAALIESDLKVRMVPPPIMIGILTSDFHVYRTMMTAEKVYPERIYPVIADSDPLMFVHQCIRECAAVIHGRLTGLF